jgi:hypothetical protein
MRDGRSTRLWPEEQKSTSRPRWLSPSSPGPSQPTRSPDAKARELIAEVRHHVEEDDHELLPELKDALGSERLEEEALWARCDRGYINGPRHERCPLRGQR